MKRAKVTFFMIAYNEEKLVRRAIQSVLDQTEPDIELYVRNNGSTDRTGEIVREIIQEDNRVHLVENQVNWWKDTERNIPFVNENGAIDIWPVDRNTLGDYVSFLDADDRIEPSFVEELLRAAQKEQAEITVCGSMFLQDGITPVGQRIPPPLHLKKREEWGPALRDFNTFVMLYNSFRTYWGKLFRRDFFLRYYDEAWQPIGGPYGSFLDTATVLRYLRRCEHLACVIKPLYLFTLGRGSTYLNFSSTASVGKALSAETLFDEGQAFLQSAEALTQKNVDFLYQLNWAYCWEAMEGLQRIEKPGPYDVDRIITMLNNRVAAVYLPQHSEGICQQIEPLLQVVWTKIGHPLELYLRYPFRLMYARRLAKENPASVLLPLLIVGILSDMENHHGLGEDLLPKIAEHHQGLAASLQYVGKDWAKRHNDLHNFWVAQIQVLDDRKKGPTEALAQNLREAFEEGRYEEASSLLYELSGKSPLHRDGIFYRIQLAELIGEHELAVVLATSARVLFGMDTEMQNLCWCILAQGGE